jgi:hypothetical protein
MREVYKDLIDDFLKTTKIGTLDNIVSEIRQNFKYLKTSNTYGKIYTNSFALTEIFLFSTVVVKKGLPPIYWLPEDLGGGLPYITICLNAKYFKTRDFKLHKQKI